MNTLYIHCQTKDYILDIVAAHAGMRINKVYSVNNFHIHQIPHTKIAYQVSNS